MSSRLAPSGQVDDHGEFGFVVERQQLDRHRLGGEQQQASSVATPTPIRNSQRGQRVCGSLGAATTR